MLNTKFKVAHAFKFLIIIALFFSFLNLAHGGKDRTKIKIKAATIAPKGSPWDIGLSGYLKDIKKTSKNKIKVKYYGAGVLGGEVSMVRSLKKGKIHIWGGTAGALATVVPELNVFELPFLFMSRKEVDKVLTKMTLNTRELSKKYDIYFVFFTSVGWRSLGSIKKRIAKVEDIKGMKMRSQESKYHLEMWKKLNTNPIPISIIETMSALQTGIVDGLDNSPMWFMTTSWYQAIKYLLLSEHMYQPAVVAMSLKKYNSLSDSFKKVFIDSIGPWPKKNTDMIRNFDKEVIKNFIKSGIEIINISDSERLKMKSMTSEVHSLFLKSTTADGKKFYNKIQKLLKK